MNKSKFLFLSLFLLIFAANTAVFAQSEPKQIKAENCYEVVLQIVTGSNKSNAKFAVPATLSDTVKKLRTHYDFTGYELTETFLQRMSDSFDYRSLMDYEVSEQFRKAPTFVEWSLRKPQEAVDKNGRKTIQFDVFRFGARVPVITQIAKTEEGSALPVYNYEQTGITTNRFSISENQPTVIGSLIGANQNERLFLILTVKSVE